MGKLPNNNCYIPGCEKVFSASTMWQRNPGKQEVTIFGYFVTKTELQILKEMCLQVDITDAKRIDKSKREETYHVCCVIDYKYLSEYPYGTEAGRILFG